MVSFDAGVAGTSAATWRADPRLDDRPPLDLLGVDELLVVAAHPDDETLGAGGLIALCSGRGIRVTIVVVTDGAASGAEGIATARSAELAAAAVILGADVVELGFADGATREHRAEITAALLKHISRASRSALVVAPWRGDGHRDHRVVGEIAAELAAGRRFAEYPVWLWHWGHPESVDMPWHRMVSVTVDATKQRALDHYSSQTTGEHPVLRADFLENFTGDREFFVTGSSS
ncbi:hypothetical protein GCM10007382_12930 [Salinibacterium xinjiangense]|uniref:N-acetylglucosaminyl deacetylase, LmbE family n=1 Tax=Salinibacterium xinjiangense TaxID=386302 RepID=A0A2C8Z3A4_9MICO|nr:PIG-L deacetylase family protein [Salinibacterium xinjiangense]GGK94080.1 hypothetical protein GCM10007382_12930 [Salinibacterium xinjiangense]SOE58151.1 N-acetylglucosaminyl deacetylase, LmbE family [Salinibacterium xinjiangense]